MAQKREIDWQECFGKTRLYTMLMVQSKHEPMRFSAELASLYQQEFSFIADYAPNRDLPDIRFSTYYSILDPAHDVQMVVMANRTEVPAVVDNSRQNTLFSLPMFDDYYYFFNGKGKDKRLFGCPLNNYDYLIFLYSDRNYNTDDIVGKLRTKPSYMTENVSYLLEPQELKAEAKRRISVLMNLIEYMGVQMNHVQEERLRERLNNKEIPMSNYVHRRFQVAQVITSPLLEREDI